MRGIEKIVNQILEEAHEQESKIQEQAHIEIEEIEEKSKDKVADIQSKNQEEIDREIKKIEDLSKLSIEQKKRRTILEEKQEIICKVIEEAYKELLEMDNKEYLNLVLNMIEKFAVSKSGEIYFNERDLAIIDEAFEKEIEEKAKAKGGSLKLVREPKEIDKGFILTYGGIEENCTFKALIESKREELQDLIQRILFS